ncbi:MAG: polysaccharide biosynthesis protein PslG, partial [Thermoleophilaceae bacterium]|nr:polysaccharide biosynthesis protein PslG [Thermoleophilaceae bacterium]
MARRLLTVVAVACAGAAATPAAASPISSAAQLYTCCSPEALQERLFSEAEASGSEYVRVDVELHGIFESPGGPDHPDWSHLDRMVEIARPHHVKLLGILRGSPSWLSSCPRSSAEKRANCAPRDPNEWGRLTGEVAAHARGSIDHW